MHTLLTLSLNSHLENELFVTDSTLGTHSLTLMANEALALDDSMFLFLHDCSRRTDPFTSATVGAKLSIDYHLFLCCPAGERKKGSIGTEPAMPEFFFKEEREEDTDGYECWEHWQLFA